MEPGSLSPELVLAGTVLPVIGVVAVAVLGFALPTPGARQAALAAGPLALAALLWWLCPAVFHGGNMLAAALYLLYWIGCALYYPILALVLVVRARCRARPTTAAEAG